MNLKLSKSEIEAGRSAAGGFTKKQLAKWGVPYPPPKGWLKALLRGEPIPQKPKKRQKWKPKTTRRKAYTEFLHREMDREHRSIIE